MLTDHRQHLLHPRLPRHIPGPVGIPIRRRRGTKLGRRNILRPNNHLPELFPLRQKLPILHILVRLIAENETGKPIPILFADILGDLGRRLRGILLQAHAVNHFEIRFLGEGKECIDILLIGNIDRRPLRRIAPHPQMFDP